MLFICSSLSLCSCLYVAISVSFSREGSDPKTDSRSTFFKIKVHINHFLEDYTDPQLTVIRIGDIQSRKLYTPPYCMWKTDVEEP